MAGLLELERLCTVLPARIDEAANELAKGVVRAIDRDLVEHTPVDVTTAVSNWQPGVRLPADFMLPAIFPGEAGSTAPQSRREAIAHTERALKDKDPGVPFWLSNVAPWIGPLNDGTSKQEPAGFVERAIRKGELFASTAVLRMPA
jgi:hypothetical protein